MRSVNWEVCFENDKDVNAIFSSFCSKLNQIIDKQIPIVKISRKEQGFKTKPWITKGLKNLN